MECLPTVSRRGFIASASMASAAAALGMVQGTECGGSPVKFMLFADLHCYDAYPNGDLSFIDEIIRQAKAQGCEFMVHLGDFVHNVKDPMQRECVRRYNECGIPAYHVMGNHDMDMTSYLEVVKAFKMPDAHYYFDRGGFRFIALDANYARTADGQYLHFERGHPSWKVKPGEVNDWIPPWQVAWLEKTIAQSAFPCILMAHHSFERPPSLSGVQNGEEIRRVIDEANRRKPGSVRMVLNGHHHIDNLRILENVLYWDVNSASYMIYGRKHDKYPADYVKKHYMASSCLAWDAPLYAIVTLWPNGRVKICGTKANWRFGVTPEQAGLPRYGRDGRPVCPKIQSADLLLEYV